ncbi:MAG: hypothetical protein GY749_42715 [Desulfobacteraceae bacterium]|nr:hypothetical protein [Desulfobacteraceae bacterium]
MLCFKNDARGRIHKLGDSLKIPLVLVPMLRVGMQGAALRADIPKAKFVWQISVPQLMDTPMSGFSSDTQECKRQAKRSFAFCRAALCEKRKIASLVFRTPLYNPDIIYETEPTDHSSQPDIC